MFKERVSRQWQYYVWLVVVARLLFPFAPGTNLMAMLFQGIDRAAEQMEIVSPYAQQSGIVDSAQTGEGTVGLNHLHSEPTEQMEPLFIRKITIYQDFVKYIRSGCAEVADFDYTILHDLMHFKRWDMFYKWLVQFTVCVHWFNPLVYLMSRETGRVCELSCDEAVIWELDEQGRQAYGDTLLNIQWLVDNKLNKT